MSGICWPTTTDASRFRDDVRLVLRLERLERGLDRSERLDGPELGLADRVADVGRLYVHVLGDPGVEEVHIVHAPLDAEGPRGRDVHVHETGDDLDLRRPGVEVPHHGVHLVQLIRDVGHDEGVRPVVHLDVAALGQCLLDRLRHFLRIGVVHREDPGLEREELFLVPRGGVSLQLFLAERVQVRDDDGLARLDHAQALRLEQDVERVPPRHVPESQGHLTLDLLARHDVLAAELGQAAEHRLDVGALDVERHPPTVRGLHAIVVLGSGVLVLRRRRSGRVHREDQIVPDAAQRVRRGLRQIDHDPRAGFLAPARLGRANGLHGRSVASGPRALAEAELGSRTVHHDPVRGLEGEVVIVERSVPFDDDLRRGTRILQRDALDGCRERRARGQKKGRRQRRDAAA
jgi:hypothetical protein